MLIGIDASRAVKTQKTGVEWYSYFLIKALTQIDQKNKYLLYLQSNAKKEKNFGFDFELPKNFKVKILNWPFKFFWTLGRFSLEMFKNPPEILFIPSHVFPLILPKKSLITIHDIGFDRFPQAYSFFEKKYHRFVIKFAKKYASKIITISQFTKKELIEIYKINPEKIKVVYHGLCLEKFKSVDNSPIISYQLPATSYFLYIGRIETKKNIINLLKAFKQILFDSRKDLKLVLVGKKGYGYQKIIETIKNLSLEKQVIQLGYISEEEKIYLMKNALAFVFPSFYEGFGLPILEAMAYSLPVITSETSSLPEIAREAAFLINPYSSEKLSQAMLKITLDENLRKEMIKRGLERVKYFSWEKCAKETLSIIQSI